MPWPGQEKRALRRSAGPSLDFSTFDFQRTVAGSIACTFRIQKLPEGNESVT